VSDEDLARIPYAQLWLAELGAHVPEWRSAPRRVAEPPRTPAPDDPDHAGQFTRGDQHR
jgi:hypothetical protein